MASAKQPQITTNELLRIHRKRAGLTAQDVGTQIGCSYRSVLRWENGNGLPDIEQAAQMAYLYDIEITDLYVTPGQPPTPASPAPTDGPDVEPPELGRADQLLAPAR